MKQLLIIYLIVCFTKLTLGQSVQIEGRVMNNNAAIAYASIGSNKPNIGGVTNDSGYFSFNAPIGKLHLKISALGYMPATRSIEVKANQKYFVNFNLTQDPTQLTEVTISGTLKEVSRMNSPIPVEIYTPKFFLKNPSSNLFESLQMINGVQPTINCNVCNTGDIHLNGMEGPYTMVLIDGMPIVSALSTVYGLSGIPNSMIERIEIVKGPASTLYGSEAVAGLINVITKNATKAPMLSFDAFTTGYNEHSLDIGFSVKGKKAAGLFSLSSSALNTKWDKNNDNFTDVTLFKRISFFNKWNFVRAKKRSASMAYRYYLEDRFGGEMQFNNSYRGSNQVYGESITTNRFEVIGNYQLPIKESVNLTYSYNFHDQQSNYGINTFNAFQQVLFTQLVWNKLIGTKHDLTSGMAFRFTYYDDNTPATTSALNNKPSYKYMPGIYVQDNIKFNKRNEMLLGLRYDYYKDHGSILSPRIAFKISKNPYETIRFSMGNGFRVVNLFTEDHAALTGARSVVVKEALRPEQSWNANINYVRFVSLGKGFLNIDASAFYTYFTNRIIADYNTNPNEIIYSNLDGYAVSRGISLNTDITFSSPLKLNLGVTYMNVFKLDKDSLGNSIKQTQIHAPNWMGTFQLTYLIKNWNLTFDLTGTVYGPMRLPILPNDYRPEYSPWYGLVNIQSTYKMNQKWQLYGGLKNLFNFIPKNPIMRPFDPFDKTVNINNPNNYTFDPNYNYAPIQGIRWFVGVRYIVN